MRKLIKKIHYLAQYIIFYPVIILSENKLGCHPTLMQRLRSR